MPLYRIPVEISNNKLPSSAFNIWQVRTVTGSEDPGPAMAAIRSWYSSVSQYLATGSVVMFPANVVETTTQEEVTPASVPANVTTTSTTMSQAGLAIVVSWKTSIRARRGRGRTFFGPCTSGVHDTNTGLLNPTVKTAFTNATQTLVTASLAGSGWSIGVWGQENALDPTAMVFRDVTGFQVRDKFSYLRSRRD